MGGYLKTSLGRVSLCSVVYIPLLFALRAYCRRGLNTCRHCKCGEESLYQVATGTDSGRRHGITPCRFLSQLTVRYSLYSQESRNEEVGAQHTDLHEKDADPLLSSDQLKLAQRRRLSIHFVTSAVPTGTARFQGVAQSEKACRVIFCGLSSSVHHAAFRAHCPRLEYIGKGWRRSRQSA